MGKWRMERTKYRAFVTADGVEEVHEATSESDHSPWPEDSAACSCGVSVGPQRRGSLGQLKDHFRELGVEDPEIVS